MQSSLRPSGPGTTGGVAVGVGIRDVVVAAGVAVTLDFGVIGVSASDVTTEDVPRPVMLTANAIPPTIATKPTTDTIQGIGLREAFAFTGWMAGAAGGCRRGAGAPDARGLGTGTLDAAVLGAGLLSVDHPENIICEDDGECDCIDGRGGRG